MQTTIELVQRCVKRRYTSLLSDDAKAEILTLLFFVQSDVRLNQLATDTQLLELWETIRESESKVDFLLGLTQELYFQLGADGWAPLQESLANSFTMIYEASISLDDPVGGELLERMSNREFLKLNLGLYPWLVTLMVIEMIDLDVALVGARPDGEE